MGHAEAAISFTDVGASYFLPKCDHGLGCFIGLTGQALGAAEVLSLGLMDFSVSSHDFSAIEHSLLACDVLDAPTVTQVLAGYHQTPDFNTPLLLNSDQVARGWLVSIEDFLRC